MKKVGLIVLLTFIIVTGYSLSISPEPQKTPKQVNPEDSTNNTKVTIGRDAVSFEKNDSSTNVSVGDREVEILESMEGSKIRVRRNHSYDNWNDDNNEYHFKRRDRFRGHWTGIELGLNNYVTSDKSLVLPDDINYMTLHSGKSTNFNINFSQISLGLSRHIGFVTGLGLNWNNYRFDGNNNIVKGANGVIEELDPGVKLEKSKLTTLFLTVPFMFEMQIPANHNNLTIAAGPIGAIKLSSHTKMVFEDGDKVKSNGDFSLNLLRYGYTARVGFGNFMIYGTYYMTPLFRTGKGPGNVELHPFEIGLALTFND